MNIMNIFNYVYLGSGKFFIGMVIDLVGFVWVVN